LENDLDVCLCGIGIAIRHSATQLELSWIRQLLRSANANVGKIAIRITGEGTRTADAELLQRELGVRKSRHLRRNKCRRLSGLFGSLNGWVVPLSLFDEHGQRRGNATFVVHLTASLSRLSLLAYSLGRGE